jgi:alanyl-tRNA synthetase
VKKLPENLAEAFEATVDKSQRFASACNHTATHLLHAALRKVLGNHVSQKGSSVHAGGLRFDFSHFSKLTIEELEQVETAVNNQIQQAISLQEFRSISMKEALEKGALALFGEKYGEQVRAIKFGDSIELCGGTHVENTQSIWHFKIINESAIAAGIRRIEAITGSAAKRYFTGIDQELLSIKKSLKNPKNPLKAVEELTLENTALKKKLEDFQKQQLASLVNEFSGELQTLNGIQFLIKEVNVDSKMAKELAFQLGAKHKNVFLLFGFENDGKAGLTCYVSKELAQEKKLHANEFIKELSTHINGSGGGQPFFASAGGTNPTGISIALGIAEKKLEEF